MASIHLLTCSLIHSSHKSYNSVQYSFIYKATVRSAHFLSHIFQPPNTHPTTFSTFMDSSGFYLYRYTFQCRYMNCNCLLYGVSGKYVVACLSRYNIQCVIYLMYTDRHRRSSPITTKYIVYTNIVFCYFVCVRLHVNFQLSL